MTTKQSNSRNDEEEIRDLVAKWSQALENKDLDGLTANYTTDTLLFDGIPPYKTVGGENIRKVWENCLPYFPERFKSEHRDVVVNVDGDVAFVHCVHHFIPMPADHPCGQTWMRVTVCFRRIDGQWKVLHEHVSIPFNPMNNEAWYITNPDEVTMPEYSESPTT